MDPNSPACFFIHVSMAGSRSTAPLNRSNSDLIVAPLFRDLRLRNTLHEKASGLWRPEERRGYFLGNAVAFTDSERFVGKQEVIRFLPICPSLGNNRQGDQAD